MRKVPPLLPPSPEPGTNRSGIEGKAAAPAYLPVMSMPTNTAGVEPRCTRRSTLERPAFRAASTALTTWIGEVTAWLFTETIRSPRWRPCSAAFELGSMVVMITPRAPAGRLAARASSGVSGASERPSARCGVVAEEPPFAAAPELLPEILASCSSVGRSPTCTVTVARLPLRMISSGTLDPTVVFATR